MLAVSGLVLLFGAWWLYFLEPTGSGLEARRHLSFLFGYGHYGVFAALAALGAGLEVAVEAATHHIEASPLLVAYAVAVPVGLYLLLLLAIFTPLTDSPVIQPVHLAGSAAAVLLLPLTTTWWSPTTVVALVATVIAVLVAVTITRSATSTVVA